MRRKNSSTSSSIDSSSNHSTLSSASSSLSGPRRTKRDLSTDLQLGLAISSTSQQQQQQHSCSFPPRETYPSALAAAGVLDDDESKKMTLFVKVYMEGIPIGRKLDLLAHDGYHDLIRTLDLMFNTTILWAEGEELQPEKCHVLTYGDSEGDWMIVGDVPWEMFLSTVKRLKITRIQ